MKVFQTVVKSELFRYSNEIRYQAGPVNCEKVNRRHMYVK